MPLYLPSPTYTGAEPLTSGEAIYTRALAQNLDAMATGVMLVTFWTAATTGTATEVITSTSGTAASGLTVAQIGVYSVGTGNALTLLASTANLDGTLWTATYTGYTSTLTSSFNRVEGTRYAVGFLAVGTTPPSLGGLSGVGAFLDLAPINCATVSGLSSLPSTVTSGNVVAGYMQPLAIVAP